MTSTPVKEVGSLFANMTATQAGKVGIGNVNFQNVWSNQMNKSAMGNASQQDNAAGAARKQSQAGEKLQRGNSLKVRENQAPQEEAAAMEELSPEEQTRAMEALNTAALELMQEIADAFGITVEELQAAMEGLEMETLDVLDSSQLGNLLLSLGGAEDLYALVTDGELYDSYRMLMNRLTELMQENAQALEMDPEQLQELLQEGLEQGAVSEETQMPAQAVGTVEQEIRDTEPVDRNPSGEEPTQSTGLTEAAKDVVVREEEAQSREQGQTGGEERRSEGKAEKEQPVNLFLQNLRTEQFQPGAGQVQNLVPDSPWSESTQAIMDQILDYMKLQLNGDATNLEMQLHPASLGTLQIQLASKAGVVTANFIAQNEAVKAALETQMVLLKEQFEEQGIKVESIEVTVQTHEFERNLDEQGRGRNNQPEKKSRTRRVSLNAGLSTESTEEEEAPAAGRVRAAGSTVEYTA